MSEQLNKSQRYVYVLLTGTNTIVAKLIRLYTGKPFSHVSLALDAELEELYSFARKQRFNPLNSGFVKESLNKGVFGADKNAQCGVYQVPVTDEQYENISEEIKHFVKNEDDYGYNYLGLFSAMFGKNVVNDTHFLCSQFVYHICQKSGVMLFPETDMLVRPFDFHLQLKDKQIYMGKLNEYRQYLDSQDDMDSMYSEENYAEAM